MKTFSSTAGLIPGLATPALFAQTVSRGKWWPAPHLLEIDRAVCRTIAHADPPILVIEAPPRHGKSELISKYLPAWYLGVFPDRQVMLAGYETNFARSFGRKARELLLEWGPRLFGVRVRSNARAAGDWRLEGHEGGMLTAGVGGPMTGRGAHLLIIDDPLKNAEQSHSAVIRDKHWDWWQSTASTRVEPGGCVIVIATRWHIDDLSGRLLAQAEDPEGQPVRRLRLPAFAEEHDPLGRRPNEVLWPERWPAERLERQHRLLSEEWWQALYQQDPLAQSRGQWPADYFGDWLWADEWPERFDDAVVGCDPATGTVRGDYSAAVFVGRVGGMYYIDARLERTPPELFLGEALVLAGQYHATRLVLESNLYGNLLGRDLELLCRSRYQSLTVDVSLNVAPKGIRISRLGRFLRDRRFRLRRGPACQLLLSQLREFPHGRHDDGPDALEFALRFLPDPAEWLRDGLPVDP
ncbi:MAG: terminase large subunit domain-containing protein [Planctomycetaceae bacterium]